MDPATEIAQLKAQVAALTQAVEALKFFLHLEPPGTKEGIGAGLHLRCTSLTLCDPAEPFNPQKAQALLAGGKKGPLLTLNGSDAKPRLTLSVTKEDARCELFGKDLKQSVLIHSEEASARGLVEVLDASQPRALIRAVEKAGVVSVLHGEQQVRALMRGDAKGADLQVLNTRQQVVVQITSDQPHGGTVLVKNAAGKPAAAMDSINGEGAFIAFNQKEEISATLRATDKGGGLVLNGPGEKSTVSAFGTELGGFVRVSGPAGQTAAELTAEPHGGAVLVCDKQGRERGAMRLLNADPQVLLRREDTKVGGAFAMAGGEALVQLHSAAGPLTALEARPDGGRLSILDAGKKLQFVAGAGEGKAWMHLKPEEGGRCAASVGTTETGGFVLVSGLDGVRRAGMGATAEGGQMGVFNDLGIERALIGTMGDGGLVKLNWGGTPGVIAAVTEKGGLVVVNDADGNKNVTLPPTAEGD
jgi:hypothetical protein